MATSLQKLASRLRVGVAIASLAAGGCGPAETGPCPSGDCASDAGVPDGGFPIATADPSEGYPGGAATNTTLLGGDAFSFPAPGLDSERRGFFATGDALFSQPWVAAPASTTARDGLGPVFNASSCDGCHASDGRGRPPETPDEPLLGLLVRLSVSGEDAMGRSLPEPSYGGQLQPRSIRDVPVESHVRVEYAEAAGAFGDGAPYSLRHPTYTVTDLAWGPLDPAARLSLRIAPIMIGMGLLEAIPEDAIRALEDPDDLDGDGISGRAATVWDVTEARMRLGRFGWKSEVPSVRQQTAGALNGDMGITSSVAPGDPCTSAEPECLAEPNGAGTDGLEITDALLDRLVFYASVLAPPGRVRWNDPAVLRGKWLFGEAGCASCHVGRHETGDDPRFPELSGQVIWPYTDLLLHDMGDELADPHDGEMAREWRTPPLWGIGWVEDVNGHTFFLHDGRARNLEEAILFHGGEAEASREAYRAMPPADRQSVLLFLESM